jgi:hypothetical protein
MGLTPSEPTLLAEGGVPTCNHLEGLLSACKLLLMCLLDDLANLLKEAGSKQAEALLSRLSIASLIASMRGIQLCCVSYILHPQLAHHVWMLWKGIRGPLLVSPGLASMEAHVCLLSTKQNLWG